MAERNNVFWLSREKKLKSLEVEWYRRQQKDENDSTGNKEDRKDYSMGGSLDGELERVVGNHVLLAGPLIDFYLLEIGKAFLEKLRRSHLTGLVPPVITHMPIQVFNFLSTLCVGYGADIKRTEKKIVMFLDKEEGAQKLFNPKRFDGTYFLAKQKYQKKIVDGNNVSVYAGCAKVVVSLYTPIKFDYVEANQKMTTSFFIQRYDENNFAVDKSLQGMMNQINENESETE